MLRLADSRQAELAAAASNHPCGDAPRPQREREPFDAVGVTSAITSRCSQIRSLCASAAAWPAHRSATPSRR